jgi:NADPH:quinone reductase-like Zn-dependent oxidoreductase
MIQGLLVSSFPIVLGCDASGVVVEAGKEAESHFKVGDRVCGCTRLGEPGYGTFQEYFLMDANLTIPLPKKISFHEGSSVGVGSETACLGLFNGLKIKLPNPKSLPDARDEWILILGGAGSVGQYAVQLAKLSGYKVVATCSQKSASLVQRLGADAVIDYRKSEEEQLQDLKAITGGNFFGVFDTVAKFADWSLKALREASTTEKKHFATTNDWYVK